MISIVSGNIGADSPTLVLSENPVWRVPAYLSFPRFGQVGLVGEIDVDVKTGEMSNGQECKSSIEDAADQLTKRLAPYVMNQTVPQAHIPSNISSAPILHLDETDLWTEEETSGDLVNEATSHS